MRRGGASAKRQIARNRGIRTANKGTWQVITISFKYHSCLDVFTLITRSRGNPGRDACEEPANRLRGPLNNFQGDADDAELLIVRHKDSGEFASYLTIRKSLTLSF